MSSEKHSTFPFAATVASVTVSFVHRYAP